MKYSIHRFAFLFSLQLVFSSAAFCADKVVEKPVVADTAEKFADVATEVRKQMGSGGRYEFIRPDDKTKADDDLNSMAAMLQKSGSVGAMSQQEKTQLFNTQEHLNGILTRSDSNRLVCEHRPPLGTNIPTTTCKTVGEIERMRRDSQKSIGDASIKGNTCMGQSYCKSKGD